MIRSPNTAARWRELVGPDAVAVGDAVRAYSINGSTPQCVLFPSTIEQLSRCVAAGDEADTAVVPVGNGSQLGLGNAPHRYDVALSTRRIARILAHEAADMTVTVEAGATLAEVNGALEPSQQHLPLDPPHPDRTTIGALIATDASGPLRLSQGKVRDLLIGIKVVRADGSLVRGGGRVVKNVAGYDLMKLFTGSFGTLGAVVEATFKVRPLPEAEAVFIVRVPDFAACIRLGLDVLGAAMTPRYVEVLNGAATTAIATGDAPIVLVGCGGGPAEVETQYARLRELAAEHRCERSDGAEARRQHVALRDFPESDAVSDTSGSVCGCRVSLLPSKLAQLLPQVQAEAERRAPGCAWLCHVGSGVVYVRWPARDDDGAIQFATWLRRTVRGLGGWTMVDRFPTHLKARIDTWDTDVPALHLMRGIKATLDPRHRFSPGRFVGGI